MTIRKSVVLGLACLAAICTGISYIQAEDSEVATMVQPAYTGAGELTLPKDYEDWVFVGSSLGLSYSEEQRGEGPGAFHHVYIQPEAYRHYRETGTFPEKTMLVMENYSAGSKVNPNLHGHFSDEFEGLEVALKDKAQFPEGWAYFNFSSRNGLKETAKAFPKAACFDCHDQHAVDDNVFVQFYPVLKREMVKQGRWKGEGAEAEAEKKDGEYKPE